MGSLESQSAAVASKVSHATTLVPAALRSLEARLDELAPGTRGPAAAEQVVPTKPGPSSLEPSADVADDELDEAETSDRLPTPVAPIRGTDP
jgi:hypothetical protein